MNNKQPIGTFLSGLLLTLALLLPSCMPKSEVEETTLTLDKSSITSNKDGGDVTVNVSTNNATWMAYSAAEGKWLSLKQEGNTLTISIKANVAGVDRKTTIIVSAGPFSQRVELTQSASDASLEYDPAELAFGAKGGRKVINVASNVGVWNVVPEKEVEWLKLSAEPALHRVVVEVQENEAYDARVINLVAKSGNLTKPIKVSQAGKDKFILPLAPEGATNFAIIYFEQDRGSVIKPFAGYDDMVMNHGISFLTTCENMPVIKYATRFQRETYEFVEITAKKKAVLSEEYKQFMESHGYKYYDDLIGKRRFQNDSKETMQEVEIRYQDDSDECLIVFTKLYKQEKPMPTMKKLHLDIAERFLKDTSKTIEDVENFENETGSEFIIRLKWQGKFATKNLFYRMPKVDPDYLTYGRIWFFGDDKYRDGKYNEKPYQMYEVFDNTDVMFFNGEPKEVSPKWVLTKEFQDLLRKEGFKDTGKVISPYKWKVFQYKNTGILLVPMVGQRDQFFEDGRACAELGWLYIAEAGK